MDEILQGNVYKGVKILDIYKKNGIKFCKCLCPKHGEFSKRFHDLEKASNGCPKCTNEKKAKDARRPISEFLKAAEEAHGKKYIYKDLPDSFLSTTKISIICPKHGLFEQAISTHLGGCGCPKCAGEKIGNMHRISTEQVVKKCFDVWGDRYDFSKVKWVDFRHKIDVVCRKHGVFSTSYFDFVKGHGCPKCAAESTSTSEEEFKKRMHELNGDGIVYPEGFEFSISKKMKIFFKGEEFDKTMSSFKRTKLLTKSSKKELAMKRGMEKAKNRWKNINSELKAMYGDSLSFKKEQIDYIKSGMAEREYELDIYCSKHGWRKQNFFELRCGYGCPSCMAKKTSKGEKQLADLIKKYYNGDIIENDRTLLDGKELDIYLPEKKLAFEYDGIYWHDNVNNYYKFEQCRLKGVRLIQINEWEWMNNFDKISYFVKSLFSVPERKIFARKTIVKEIDNATYKDFCLKNHLQGYALASVRLGLFSDGELVEIESFSKARYGKYQWELIRECSKNDVLVIGGKSKLLKYFEEKYKPENIVSYCEKNKFSGTSYYKCGFNLLRESFPSYEYFDSKNNRRSRLEFQKHKLGELLENYDPEKSEWENMSANGYKRLFDYGNFVFYKEIQK